MTESTSYRLNYMTVLSLTLQFASPSSILLKLAYRVMRLLISTLSGLEQIDQMQSVFAFIILALIASLSSVRFILDLSTLLLLDIFLLPSVNDITLGVEDAMYSGLGRDPPQILLNLSMILLVSSRCWTWSDPTGTLVAPYSMISAAINTGQLQSPRLGLSFLSFFSLYCIIEFKRQWGVMHPRIQQSSACWGT